MPQPAIHFRQPRLDFAAFAFGLRWFPFVILAIVLFAVGPLGAQDRATTHKVPPVYPPIARQLGITGTVVVITTVDAAGKVVKAESTSGNKLLASAAIDAVKQWKFSAGNATETFPVSVNFEKN